MMMTMVGCKKCGGGEKVGISSLSKKWMIRRQEQGATSVVLSGAGIEHSFAKVLAGGFLVRKIKDLDP